MPPIFCSLCAPDMANVVCDRCRHIEREKDEEGGPGCVTGYGWCRLHRLRVDLQDGCREYHCVNADRNPAP